MKIANEKLYKGRHYYMPEDFDGTEINGTVTAKIVDYKRGTIEFLDENGQSWGLTSEHSPDCCEDHYLDMQMLFDCNIGTATGLHINVREQQFELGGTEGIKFKRVDGEGIILYDKQGNKYFIAGRGYNNGYYNTNIDLVLYKGNKIFKSWDVSECQEIDWC